MINKSVYFVRKQFANTNRAIKNAFKIICAEIIIITRTHPFRLHVGHSRPPLVFSDSHFTRDWPRAGAGGGHSVHSGRDADFVCILAVAQTNLPSQSPCCKEHAPLALKSKRRCSIPGCVGAIRVAVNDTGVGFSP